MPDETMTCPYCLKEIPASKLNARSIRNEALFKERETVPRLKCMQPSDLQRSLVYYEAIKRSQQFICEVKEADLELIFEEFSYGKQKDSGKKCFETFGDNAKQVKNPVHGWEQKLNAIRTWIHKRIFPERT